MKKIYAFLVFIITTFQLHAQWTQLSSGATNILRSTYFFDVNNGLVVGESLGLGDNAPILKTTDGGLTWSNTINSGTTQALRAITFIDSTTGFIAGFTGTILKSTDGGNTWSSISSGTIQPLRSISFPSHDTGYIGGGKGTILKTVDAGETWTPLVSGIDSDIINIRFANNDVGYAVSSGSNLIDFLKGYVIKTTDGGATWSTVYYNDNDGLLGLAVPDENTAYAGGKNDLIVKTSDGGSNWAIVDSGMTAHRIRAALFLDVNRGWLTCDVGDIFYTEDGGATWTNQAVSANGLYGIYFPNTTTGYAVGAAGTILKYYSCPTLPAIGEINGETSVCDGDALGYSIQPVEGADVYTWSVPAGSTFTGTDTSIMVTFASTSGEIMVAAMNACDTVVATISITVNPLPPIPIITFTSGVLSSDAASGNQWYYNGVAIAGATNQMYTPTQDGSYSVTVTDANGCSSSSEPLEVSGVGIDEVSTGVVVSVYPNPFESYTLLTLPNNTVMENGRIVISDVTGNVVRTIENSSGNSVFISRQGLSAGVYFFQLLDKDNITICNGKLIAK